MQALVGRGRYRQTAAGSYIDACEDAFLAQFFVETLNRIDPVREYTILRPLKSHVSNTSNLPMHKLGQQSVSQARGLGAGTLSQPILQMHLRLHATSMCLPRPLQLER